MPRAPAGRISCSARGRAYVSLGRLKGNKGDQNYRLRADVDPAASTSASIWCDRFDVSFGAAELARA